MFLSVILIGIQVYNIELKFGRGGQMVCSVGICVQLMVKEGKYVFLWFLFGEFWQVLQMCCVIIGEMGNSQYVHIIWGKVGCSCWKGCCLMVCGVVMNLVDYLYGGGEGWISGGWYFVILWGVLIKGKKMWKNKKISCFIIKWCKQGNGMV